MKSRKFISLCAVVLFGNATIGQCPTAEKMVKSASKGKGGYGISTQSRTGALISGESYEMSFIAQDAYDYRITSGTFEPNNGTVPFEVYEMVTEKDASGTYKKIKKVLIASDGSAPVEITTDKARKLMIKVSLEGGSEDKKPACVGVLIEDKKTTKIGL